MFVFIFPGFWSSWVCNFTSWQTIWKESSICTSSTSSPSYSAVNLPRTKVFIWSLIVERVDFLFDLLEACYVYTSYPVSSADNKCKEESAKLLGCLIRNCERLVLPYVAPIHKVQHLYLYVLCHFSSLLLLCNTIYFRLLLRNSVRAQGSMRIVALLVES